MARMAAGEEGGGTRSAAPLTSGARLRDCGWVLDGLAL